MLIFRNNCTKDEKEVGTAERLSLNIKTKLFLSNYKLSLYDNEVTTDIDVIDLYL